MLLLTMLFSPCASLFKSDRATQRVTCRQVADGPSLVRCWCCERRRFHLVFVFPILFQARDDARPGALWPVDSAFFVHAEQDLHPQQEDVRQIFNLCHPKATGSWCPPPFFAVLIPALVISTVIAACGHSSCLMYRRYLSSKSLHPAFGLLWISGNQNFSAHQRFRYCPLSHLHRSSAGPLSVLLARSLSMSKLLFLPSTSIFCFSFPCSQPGLHILSFQAVFLIIYRLSPSANHVCSGDVFSGYRELRVAVQRDRIHPRLERPPHCLP